jgi:ADP-ribose pyrophosphatase YjhB (NUDIX family)
MLAKRALEPNKGMLDLPGGFVDPLESAEDAVRREIKEELGVKVTGMQYLTSFPNKYIFSGLTVYTLDLAYLCQIDDFNSITPQDDISSIIFIPPEKIKLSELFSISMKNIIKYYIENYLP